MDHEVVCMYLHRGTAGRDGRAFFNAAFATRPHEKQPEYVEGVSLTSLVQAHSPTIVKVDIPPTICKPLGGDQGGWWFRFRFQFDRARWCPGGGRWCPDFENVFAHFWAF